MVRNKMSKIYIHIGLQKTASTYLQTKIFPSIQGLYYFGRPYTQVNNAFNSLQFADEALYDSSLLQKEIEAIKSTARGHPILISDELFSGYAFWGFVNRGLIAKRLSEAVPEAEIILFIRNQTDLINSLYNQYVKIGWYSKKLGPEFLYEPGSGFELDDWIKGKRNGGFSRRRFSQRSLFSPEIFLYSKSLELYKRLFSKVHVFLYEDFEKESHRQIERLGSILDLAINPPCDEGKVVNRGLKQKELKCKILENRIATIVGPSNSKLRKILLKSLTHFQKEQSDSERVDYIRNTLSNAGVFQDNRLLSELYPEEVPKLSHHYLDEC